MKTFLTILGISLICSAPILPSFGGLMMAVAGGTLLGAGLTLAMQPKVTVKAR